MRFALAGLVASIAGACGSAGDGDGSADSGPDASVADAGSPGDAGAMRDAGADGGMMEPECVDLREAPLSTAFPRAMPVDHPVAPDGFDDGLTGPFPTNAWWMNLVVGGRDLPVNSWPYLLRTFDERLSVSEPRVNSEPNFLLSPHVDDLSIGATQTLSGRVVVDHDELSATVRWSGPAGSTMEAPLVRGMAYVTMFYDGLTPRFSTVHGILSVNGGSSPTVTGKRFEVTLRNGRTWVIYTSDSLTLQRAGSLLFASEPFTGHVRAAFLDEAGDEDVLDASADAVPTGGTVAVSACRDTGIVELEFERQGEGPLLMLGLPHHRDLLVDGASASIRRDTIRGEMFGLTGDAWRLEVPLSTIGFEAPRPIAPDREAAVRSALRADQSFTPAATDAYFGGKQVALMGRLALIADELGETAIATGIRTRLATALSDVFDGSLPALSYDRTWGGIVSQGAHLNPGASFGQGYYNDHHFHWGYWIYAAAALAKGDPTWLEGHREAVDGLVRDIANPSRDDEFFIPFRSLDWYVGHSWAAGLFQFADSRNQESTSEAVNAWYAVALWGDVSGRRAVEDLGRVMTATEIRSAQTYWQITADDPVYGGTQFADNRVVGILWSTRADYNTFFGNNTEFIHCIQMLPFTPISEALLAPDWIEDEYPVLSTALTRESPAISDGWRGFVYLAHGILDADAAWDEVETLGGFDDGNTRTNSLYWLATRP